MKLSDADIGYAGYSRDSNAPGDRRRFVAYAACRGLKYRRADLDQNHQLVLLTHNGDVTGWTARKRRDGSGLKLVFELADSYFAQTGLTRRHLKGAARYVLGMDSHLSVDFMRTLIDACEAADAVICSTEEQVATIRRYNPKVIVSFDYFSDEIRAPKRDYHRGEKLRLVWEGQSTTLGNIISIRDVLNDFRNEIELHVVTDARLYRYFARYSPRRSEDLLAGIECPIHFHPWSLSTFSTCITAADLAIIPIDASDPFAMGKPENKLVMFWQLGMPTLTSETPAYRRAMNSAGLDLLCASLKEWRQKLQLLIETPAEGLESFGRQGRMFAEQTYSHKNFLDRFDRAFAAAGFEI